MNRRLCLLLLVFCSFLVPHSLLAATWYVRADGGTRYSVNQPSGQCDGLADAAYPGSGVNQHCGFRDYRFLWDDQSYGNSGWVIAGGDTVIVDNTQQWRVGFDGATANDAWCAGGYGAIGCVNPTIPAGTASQHTRILGRNYANCSANNVPDPTKMTQIFGGHAVSTALNLKGAQYVDVECMEITRHSQCITHGSPAYPSTCSSNYPVDDYDSDGIQTDVNTHDLLLQDLWIHGHTDRGIIGPVGGMITANRINIAYNGMAGWDFDQGDGTASINATLNFTYSTIEWNGCNQEYPIVDTYPAISCYSQSTGGYGDGIGTPAGMGMNVVMDHDTFRYNTQDGEDFGHIDTGSSTLSITNSIAYGNNGGQFKWGYNFSSAIFENNIAEGNCLRMSQPIAGAPSTYNAHLSDFCRAGSTISFNFNAGATALIANNTFVSYAPVTFNFQCAGAGTACSNATMTVTNNIFRGYDNPTTYTMGGQSGGPTTYCGPACSTGSPSIGTINRYNNTYYGMRGACEAGTATESLGGTISGETCNDALFVGELPSFTTEPALDNYDFALSSGSPAIGAGIAVSGLTTDFNGLTRPNPSSLGAMEYASSTVTLATPTLSFAAIANQSYGASPFVVSATSASAGAVTYQVTSGPATISAGRVTITGVGTVVLSANQAATSNYSGATTTTSFTVAPGLPNLSFAAVANQAFGSPAFDVVAASPSTGAVTYSVVSGPAAISGSTVTLTGAGTVVLSAGQAADANYAAGTATISFTISPEVPALSLAAIANQTYGAAPFVLSATSASTGAVTYIVLSGPATLSGGTTTVTGAGTVVLSTDSTATLSNTGTVVLTSGSTATITGGEAVVTNSGNIITVTGAGTVVLSASQAATANYAAATATTSFTVAPEIATLGFAAIATQTFGNSPITVNASSPSNGAVTYAVISGPATVSSLAGNSGGVVTITGAGTVVLSASQTATANYTAATTTTSFTVAPETPALSFVAIASQVVGNAPFVVSATSVSGGVITYGVVSGPATIDGSTVTVTDSGTVVLSASQAASGNYASATTTTSFAISPPIFSLTTANSGQTTGSTATTAPGSSAVFSLLITPVSGDTIADAVTFTASGLPSGATATFSPSTIAAGSKATTVKLTIQTAGQTSATQDRSYGKPSAPWKQKQGFALALLLVPIAGAKRIRRRLIHMGRLPILFALALASLSGIVSLSGCGSSFNQQMMQPAESYSVVVTATDAVAGWKNTTEVTVIVQ